MNPNPTASPNPLAGFAQALLAADGRLPEGLATWNGSDPAARFAVYRNNVIVSLVEALADSFPVVRQLLGEDLFNRLAREYVRARPPRTPVLAHYGESFPDFLAEHPLAQDPPHLADTARLEWLHVGAFHAADADPVRPAAIERLLADPQQLPDLCMSLHPSLALLQSAFAVASLWGDHQGTAATGPVDGTRAAESVLVQRVGLQVEVRRISAAALEFISRLRRGHSLGEAATAAIAIDGDFDLAQCLGLLIRSQAITAIRTTDEHAP